MQQLITMTADDATMNVTNWIDINFLLKTPFRGFWINLCLKDYPTHGSAESHMTSVRIYLFNILIIYGKDPNYNVTTQIVFFLI